jgi:glycosyltransferase involved in cell wall biosynthesis
MRMHPDKRPLEWLAIAERFRRRRPGARFLMVGDGALLEEARECAQRLGIADRVLFTGLSSSVGYWLTRMDTLMLVSRWEGLPNVLIEAQLAGIPVVATPAGGAPETVLNGETGWILSNAEALDVEEATARLVDISTLNPSRREAMRVTTRQWAERAFSVDSMLERSVGVFMAPQSPPRFQHAPTETGPRTSQDRDWQITPSDRHFPNFA